MGTIIFDMRPRPKNSTTVVANMFKGYINGQPFASFPYEPGFCQKITSIKREILIFTPLGVEFGYGILAILGITQHFSRGSFEKPLAVGFRHVAMMVVIGRLMATSHPVTAMIVANMCICHHSCATFASNTSTVGFSPCCHDGDNGDHHDHNQS